ncbi:hypothetical protein [Bacillus haynesii]|uniref:hypothetical protein n=1 Tax=Bacillus haynesii TaxID=1925021 RepID=UPI00227DCE18|nr:hypothetical protein [Bacillus haynesii]MCY8537945.1 hypothetical protein [Bacillus haynesii]
MIFLVRLICLAFLACLALLFYIELCTFSGDARLDRFDHCLNRLSVSCLYRGNEGMEKTKALILSSAFFLV